MADKLNLVQRRKCMQANKSEDTKPELVVRRFLRENGVGYRLHCKKLPGKPDLVLRKYSTVIFVNGCFWHGHANCKYYRVPSSNREFWLNKVEKNRDRDLRDKQKLASMGWAVMIVWECQLRPNCRDATLQELLYDLSVAYLKKKTKDTYNYGFEDEPISVAAEAEAAYGRDACCAKSPNWQEDDQ